TTGVPSRRDGAPVSTDTKQRPHAPVMDPNEQRSALVRLAMIVVAAIVAAAVTGVTKTVAVVLAIIVMIMLHELGHFLMAKSAGMKVTEFFLGFGPRLWSVRKGETEYGVKAIPAGGYVKIIGMSNLEEVPPEDEPRTYRQQPVWRRLSLRLRRHRTGLPGGKEGRGRRRRALVHGVRHPGEGHAGRTRPTGVAQGHRLLLRAADREAVEGTRSQPAAVPVARGFR